MTPRTSYPIIPVKIKHLLLIACSSIALLAPVVHAVEGGGSHYLQGTSGDFAMGLIGSPGLYIRNDLFYMEGNIGPVSRGRFLLSDFEQQAWVNTTKFIYLPDLELLGARPGFVLAIPYVLDVQASGTAIAPLSFSDSGSRSGFSDPSLTGFLNWAVGESSHIAAGLNVYSDFGSYDVDRIINLGRNYWSFDPTLTYTWLDKDRGHEVSLTGGFMFNTENPDTDYQSGTEFHLDFTLAQHFSSSFAAGVVGYYTTQVTDDTGALVGAIPVGSKGFRGEGFGLGPALTWTPKIGDRNVTFIAKWIHDFESERRFESDMVMLSAAFKF